MNKLSLVACGLIAAAGLQSVSAAVFAVTLDAYGWSEGDPRLHATGSFETLGSSGSFDLTNGISALSIQGYVGANMLFYGNLNLTDADLSALQITLLDGAVTSFSLTSKDLNVPASLLGVGEPTGVIKTSFTADLNSSPNFFVTVDGRSPLAGNATITAVREVLEPASWAMMITGFGAIGSLLRRQKQISARRA